MNKPAIEGLQFLTAEELEILNALVKSRSFQILEKAIKNDKIGFMSQLCSVKEYSEIRFSQGVVAGLERLINLPKGLAAMGEEIKKKKLAEEKRKQKRISSR